MGNLRRQHPPTFKVKVALEAIKGDKTLAEIAGEYQVHPSQIKKWKKIAISEMTQLFTDKRQRKEKDKELLIEELYKQIGQLKVELDWLKKKCGYLSEGEDLAHRTGR